MNKSQKAAPALAQTELGTEAEQPHAICTVPVPAPTTATAKVHASTDPQWPRWCVIALGRQTEWFTIESDAHAVAFALNGGVANLQSELLRSVDAYHIEKWERLVAQRDCDAANAEWERLSAALTLEVKAHHTARAEVQVLKDTVRALQLSCADIAAARDAEVTKLRAVMEDAAHRSTRGFTTDVAARLRAALERSEP